MSIYNFLNKEYPEFLRYIKDLPGTTRLMEKIYIYYFGPSVPCPVCGRPTRFLSFNRGYQQFCSIQCMSRDTSIKKKREETNKKKYSVSTPLQRPDVKTRSMKTNELRYGVPYPLQNKAIRKKALETMEDRYGTSSPQGLPHLRGKISATTQKVMRENFLREKDILGYTGDGLWIKRCSKSDCDRCSEKTYEISSQQYRDRLRLGVEPCTKINPIGSDDSIEEQEMIEYVRSLGVECISGWNGLDGKQIDCYMPSLKLGIESPNGIAIPLGIEFNGLYWHSLTIKEPEYHFDKWLKAKEKGIRLISIWEDDWKDRREWCEEFIRAQIEGRTTVHDPEWIYLDSCSEEEWKRIDPDKVELYEQIRGNHSVVSSGRIKRI